MKQTPLASPALRCGRARRCAATLRLRALLLALLAALAFGLAGACEDACAKGFVWVDKNGVTHITDKPPPPDQETQATAKITPGAAEKSPAPGKEQSPSAQRAASTGKIFMWKAVSNSNTVFLLGSIHAAKKSLYPLNPRIEEAYRGAAALVVEADADANQTQVQAMALQQGLYPEGDSLDKHISQRTKDKLKEQGLNLAMLNKFKPWFAAITIQAQRSQQMGFDPKLGIDAHFLKKARADKKEIRELENAAFQLQLMAELAEGKEDLFLYLTLTELNQMETKYNAIFDYWARGDASKLEALILAELSNPEFASLGDKLFFNRNVTMAQKIDGYLKESKPVFVIMGAGHLVGDKGVVKLLQDKGYTVDQVGG